MKITLALRLAFLSCAAPLALAQDPAPRLLGLPTPSATTVPAPEPASLNAISNDGRWMLFTSASDRLTTNDLNAASDVFLFDRTTGKTALLSTGADGRSGNGTSFAAGMSADVSRVVFQSRASNLVSNDTNGAWDVFVRDVAAGTNMLISRAKNGGSSTGPATDPRISADGRYVIFRSPARDLAPGPVLAGDNVYRRDILDGRTECLTSNLPPPSNAQSHLTSLAVTTDAQALVMSVDFGTAMSNLMTWKDLASGRSAICTTRLPGGFWVGGWPTWSFTHRGPAISADHRFVAFRTESYRSKYESIFGLSVSDMERGNNKLLTLRTNALLGWYTNHTFAWRQAFPASALVAELSADGRFVAYSAPLPSYDRSLPPHATNANGPSQVYLHDAQTQTTFLVSATPDGLTPANADATDARVTPDGRGVAFLSRATNLVAGATSDGLRAFWFDREAGTLQLIAELGEALAADAPLVLSPGGDWLAVSAPGVDGTNTFYVFDTRSKTSSSVTLVPAVSESITARGWIGVQAAGVSADGRYVALTAFPPEPAGGTNHMQVYRLDTHTGSRELLSQGVDGDLANGHPTPPSISADGSQVLFVSAATNLVAEDTNRVTDVFVHTVSTGRRQVLHGGPISLSSPAQAESLLSPDGSYAFVRFLTNYPRFQFGLADVGSDAVSGALPGVVQGIPSFSRTGHRMAVSIGVSPSVVGARIELHDPAAWLAASTDPVPALWTSASPASQPVLSADGERVAYFHISTAGTNAVVLMDWARNQPLFTQLFDRQVPSSLGLSADGRVLVWISPGSGATNLNQVWRADVDTGVVTLVSVASDGTSEGNGDSRSATISADGRYVAFASLTDNLVPDDTNGARDIFLRDLQTGQTLLVSRTPAGAPGTGWSLQPFFSADGHSLFFLSHAPDLAPGDYNQAVDLFKLEIVGDSSPLLVIRHNLTTHQAQLLWNGQPGRRYAIEFKETVEAVVWTRRPGEFTGDAPVDMDTSAAPHRFFRVIALP